MSANLYVLENRRLTLREEDQLRKALGEAGQAHRREKPARAKGRASTRPDPLLGRALAWAKQLEEEGATPAHHVTSG